MISLGMVPARRAMFSTQCGASGSRERISTSSPTRASGTSPSQKAARNEQLLVLADALSRLPDDLRRVIVLHDLEGLGLREVAGRMQRSYGSVQRSWVRGLAALRDSMAGDA